jgi:hypothetical protein
VPGHTETSPPVDFKAATAKSSNARAGSSCRVTSETRRSVESAVAVRFEWQTSWHGPRRCGNTECGILISCLLLVLPVAQLSDCFFVVEFRANQSRVCILIGSNLTQVNENYQQVGLLNNLERAIAGVENGNPLRQAAGRRPFAATRNPLFSERFGPGLDRCPPREASRRERRVRGT